MATVLSIVSTVRARAVFVAAGILGLASGCSSTQRAAQTTPAKPRDPAVRRHIRHTPAPPPGPAQRALGLPPIAHGPLPGYLLIADRNNDRALIVSPSKRVVW